MAVLHGVGYGTRPHSFSTSSCFDGTLQRLPLHARRSTSYTVCLDRFNSLAISVTTDARGLKSTTAYDQRGWATSEADPLEDATATAYNADGTAASCSGRSGQC